MKERSLNRQHRREIAAETLAIIERGWYEYPAGQRVDVGAAVTRCVAGSQLFTPSELEQLEVGKPSRTASTLFDVRNETTLSAARRLGTEDERSDLLCLNFASAKNPGGGFLGGSQAQEESLARSSCLYASLLNKPEYYEANKACGSPAYTDHIIYSPGVSVFRDDSGCLLASPYEISMLTAPAVNAGAVKNEEGEHAELIRSTMQRRIRNVLSVALHLRYEHLILGAWGCGVFRNKPNDVAEMFAEWLLDGGLFSNRFRSVTFAVLDSTRDRYVVGPFSERFARRKPLL